MKQLLPQIDEIITTQRGLELCKYFELGYLVERLTKHPGRYREWRFDGCSFLPDQLLKRIYRNWDKVLYECCLPHDLGYAYGKSGDNEERKQVDLDFERNLIAKADMHPGLARIFWGAVSIGGKESLKIPNVSWAFATKEKGK